MLKLVGLGLREGDISLRGVEAVRESDVAYAELYTNSIDYDLEALEERAGTPVREVERREVEDEDLIVEEAREREVAFLVSGDPLAATTHQDILFRARSEDIETEEVHAPSVFTAVAETGLSLYKFGRTTTLTEQSGEVPDSVFEVLEENLDSGLHTMMLLDIGMEPSHALELVEEEVDDVVVCSGLGTPERVIRYGRAGELEAGDMDPPATLVVPGELSDNEEERLQRVK